VARAAEARRLSARLPWLVRTTHGSATVVVPLLPAATGAIGIEIAAAAAARLTDRELRNLSLRRLTLGSRQRRANQPAVHGTVIIASVVARRGRVIVSAHIGALAVRLGLLARGGGGLHRRGVRPDYVLRDLFFVGHVDIGHRRAWTSGIGRVAYQHAVLLAARRRNLGLLVFMIRVARCATSLLHLVFDHRDDRVIGDAALARTIVVQNVTEPKPALLHELPRSRSFSGGIVPLDDARDTLSLAEG
jgi:hypothetical protein